MGSPVANRKHGKEAWKQPKQHRKKTTGSPTQQNLHQQIQAEPSPFKKQPRRRGLPKANRSSPGLQHLRPRGFDLNAVRRPSPTPGSVPIGGPMISSPIRGRTLN